MHRAGDQLRGVWRDTVSAVLPRECLACHLTQTVPGTPLCQTCHQQVIAGVDTPACEFCGMIVAYPDAPCTWCDGKGVANLGRVIRWGLFADALHELLLAVKFSGRWPLAGWLSRQMLNQPTIERAVMRADVLVPVPMHATRQIARGFNQAEVLARHLGRLTGTPVAMALLRQRIAPPQTTTRSKVDRDRNLRGAFALADPGPIIGRHVLLVDDVMTTGATLRHAARVLKLVKPASVDAVVAAVTDRRG